MTTTMRIQTIEITNFKAFLGKHRISVGGKNVFIYGENGSGKSSLYYALKDFWFVTQMYARFSVEAGQPCSDRGFG